MNNIEKLLEIMQALRNPQGGCPWDVEQTFSSIAPYTIEEAYEVADAIAREDYSELRSELGDLLFQVVFHARMAEEEGLFDFWDVAGSISDKLTRRHPHVFGTEEQRARGAVEGSWESIKAEERAGRGSEGPVSVLDDIPIALPALKRAAKVGKRAASVGFDWEDAAGVRAKVDEELAELEAAVAGGSADAVEDELGDLLLSITSLARHLKIDPEEALARSLRKFEGRFRGLEASAAAEGLNLKELDADALEALWQRQKSNR